MIVNAVSAIGRWVRESVSNVGFAARSFLSVLMASAGLWEVLAM